MKTAIVWFKTDLRLHDNETLIRAIENSEQIIPVYCFDEAHYKTTRFGFKKTGAIRTQFLLQSLKDLDENLRKIGSRLLLVKGNPAEELRKLVIEYKATKIYAKKEVAIEELTTQKEVEERVWPLNCSFEVFSTSTLYHAQDLPFSIKDIPDTFTNFRHKVEKESEIRNVFPTPKSIKSPAIKSLALPSLSELNLNDIKIDSRAACDFTGGESNAQKRLNYYFDERKLVSNYKETRNQLVGADYSSKFSPWLALGCISPKQIYNSLKLYEEKNGANDSTYWLIFELLWRDYFRFIMKKHKEKFFFKKGIKNNETKTGAHNQEVLMKWINGETKVDFVDANMKELKLTGFMSNRGRQNVASYLCNDLNLDWRYGAAYFEEQLIDYDVSSNWGNWAYIAGVGNDPRKDRYFNIEKQTEQYDGDKKFRLLWKS
jgi:deoxyribodipyrimidine photo-lyase